MSITRYVTRHNGAEATRSSATMAYRFATWNRYGQVVRWHVTHQAAATFARSCGGSVEPVEIVPPKARRALPVQGWTYDAANVRTDFAAAEYLRWSMYRYDYAAAAGRTVTEGHGKACDVFGHAMWIVDGVDSGVCARCGAVK